MPASDSAYHNKKSRLRKLNAAGTGGSRLQSVAAGARDRGLRAPMVRQRVGPGTALRAAGGAGMRRRARFVGGDR